MSPVSDLLLSFIEFLRPRSQGPKSLVVLSSRNRVTDFLLKSESDWTQVFCLDTENKGDVLVS